MDVMVIKVRRLLRQMDRQANRTIIF